MNQSFSKVFLFVFVSITLLIGCSKNSNSVPVTPVPSLIVKSMNPSKGPDSTVVKITGKGFGTTAANDNVSFNGKDAILISVNDSVLVARVPTMAGSGNVVVTINDRILPAGYYSYDTTYRFSVIASNITNPWYLSLDDSSNIYFSNYNLQEISKIDAQG
ncbi:MAG TPA: IPT/TIG domain-containing protein, partial [Chitinophagaceae bacterium]